MTIPFQSSLISLLRERSPEDPAQVDEKELQTATLTFLFRLLFILYAEDRRLLPVQNPSYAEHSLSEVRKKINEKLDEERENAFSDSSYKYWTHLVDLCRIIDRGDKSLRIPPYNGGLFDEKQALLLTKISISDRDFAKIFDGATRANVKKRQPGEPRRKALHFYDLNARDLGTIYEQLSQYEVELRYAAPQHKAGGGWCAIPNRNLRKEGGVYYTPEDLVQLILKETLTPLAEKCEGEDIEDPAAALLELKIVDPAMGSGHFLVGATNWLTQRVEDAIRESVREYEDNNRKKPSSVLDDIRNLRKKITDNAKVGGWTVDESEHLSDSNLVRRMVLKRCIHGVDKSPYAVEVAKLSLWLHSFTVGAPLSYLDHHIQQGRLFIWRII